MLEVISCIPLSQRVEIFYEYIKADKAEHGIGSGHSRTPATYITIHRSNLLESGYAQLSSLPASAIKGVIRVNFVNIQVSTEFVFVIMIILKSVHIHNDLKIRM